MDLTPTIRKRLMGLNLMLKLFSLAFLAVFASCDTENNYDTNEIIISIDATNWEKSPLVLKSFIVVENKASEAKYIEIKEGMDTVIRRGEEIVGGNVGVHFVNISASGCDISSYLSIPNGYAITFTGGKAIINMNSSIGNDNNSWVEVTTAAIPAEFNIITKTSMMQGHSHTYRTTEDISTICTRSFDTSFGNKFYVCLQNETTGAYEILTIPEVDSYEVSFDHLNYNMTRYQFPKIPGYYITLLCKAKGSEGLIGICRIDDDDIFTGNYLDVYVPDDLPETTRYSISMSKGREPYDGRGWNTTIRGENVITDIPFLNAGLSLSHTSGSFPKVSSANYDFNYIRMNLQKESGTKDYSWNIYSPAGKDFYKPTFPSDVLEAIDEEFSIGYMLENPLGLYVEAVKNSNLENYADILDRQTGGTYLESDSYTILTEAVRVSTLK